MTKTGVIAAFIKGLSWQLQLVRENHIKFIDVCFEFISVIHFVSQ
jgi:hypothetical protein